MLPLLGLLAPILDKALDFIPDQAKKAEARLKLEQEVNRHEESILASLSAVDQKQAEINAEEAKSSSFFKSGWRPFVAWICAVGFAWATVLQPILVFILAALKHDMITPQIHTEVLMQALFGLLGLGSMRMMEKKWGVASK